MKPFTFEAHIPRTVFGAGTLAQIPAEVERLGAQRVLLVTEDTERQRALAAKVAGLLGDRAVGVCYDAVMHTPEDVTLKALAQAKAVDADCYVSLGGGSTIGLGKALSVRTGAKHLAVPTTYAGSEATPVLGETAGGVKTTRSDPAILPATIVYDVELTLSLPRQLTNTSGLNAMAHCVEALWSVGANPVIDGIACAGIADLAGALRALKDTPDDMDARARATSGAFVAGVCLAHVPMAIHHKLCHVLGGSFGLPHSETHTVILPHAIAYNARAAQGAMAKISAALGAAPGKDAATAVYELEKELGTVTALRDLGMKREDLEKAAEIACKAQYPNPEPLEKAKLLKLLENAWEGKPPQSV